MHTGSALDCEKHPFLPNGHLCLLGQDRQPFSTTHMDTTNLNLSGASYFL